MNKYGAKGSHEPDGYFASKKELKRFRELQLLEKAGVIKDLKRQVVNKIIINDKLICKYISDAEYTEIKTGNRIVEDVKSEATRKLPVYRIKKKLVLVVLGIEITEV